MTADTLDMMARDVGAVVSCAMHTEMAAREEAAEIVAAYIGRWALATRCEWFVSEGGGPLRRVSLHVDGLEVWWCQWDEERTHVYYLVACWVRTPGSIVAARRREAGA